MEVNKPKNRNAIHYFMKIGDKIDKTKNVDLEKLKSFYRFNDTTLEVTDYTEELFTKQFDTIYRDYLLTKRNLGIYHTIDCKLHRGGEDSIQCEFFDILRENTWSVIVIRLYGLFSNSRNDFYSLKNFISICKHIYSVDLSEIETQIENYRCEEQYGFNKITKLRNKIHAHRDADCIITVDRNLITQIPIRITEQLVEKIIKETKIKPYNYDKSYDSDHYKGNCIWENIDLEKIHSKVLH